MFRPRTELRYRPDHIDLVLTWLGWLLAVLTGLFFLLGVFILADPAFAFATQEAEASGAADIVGVLAWSGVLLIFLAALLLVAGAERAARRQREAERRRTTNPVDRSK